nr:PKD domain-containing protein [Rhodopirellula sp. SM50]
MRSRKLRRRPSPPKARSAKKSRRFRPQSERLEARNLLAASLSIGNAMVDEGNPGGAPAELQFEIIRGGDTSEELTIGFEIFAAGEDELSAGQRGLATAGEDFVVPAFSTITIPSGSLNETLTITVNNDVEIEGDERLEVRFTSVIGEVTFASEEDTRATGTIVNDDPPNELLEFLQNIDNEERDRLVGQIKDGFDDTFSEIITGIQTAVDEISGVPIVGGQLTDAVEPSLSEIEDIQTGLSDLVETVFTSTSENLVADFQNAMFTILEPILIDSPDAGTDISASDILLSYGADDLDGPDGNGDGIPDSGTSWVQFDFHLGQRTIQDLPFELDLGSAAALPGLEALGLSVDASDGLRFDLRWDLRYGFGLSQLYGTDPAFDLDYFYVNSGAVDVTGSPVEEFRASIDIKSAPAKDGDGNDVLSTDAGLKADATIGLLAAKVEDGIPFAVDITAEEGFEFTGVETEVDFTLVIDAGGTQPIEAVISRTFSNPATLLAELQSELISQLDGKFNAETTGGDGQNAFAPVTVSLDFGRINGFTNPDQPTTPSIVLSAELPQISSMTIIGGGELGFSESNLGSLSSPGPFGQFDDGRSAALGFDASSFDEEGFTTASSETTPGRYQLIAGAAAPASGVLRQDTEFVLVLNNGSPDGMPEERILISIGEEQNRNLDTLRDQLNQNSLETLFRDSVNQAISQQGTYGTIDVEIDDDGFFVLTSRGDANNPGPTLDIDYASTDQSKISIAFTVDIDDPNWTLPNQRANPTDQRALDRVTRAEIQAAKKITDRFQPEAEASVALKLHTTADLNGLIDQAGGSIPSIPLIGEGFLLPKIEFDFVLDATASAKFQNPTNPDPNDDEAGEKRFTNELENLRFENVTIDSGGLIETFIKPIAQFAETALGPISVFVGGLGGSNLLGTSLPILSDLNNIRGASFPETIFDLAGGANEDLIRHFRRALGNVVDLLDPNSPLGRILADLGEKPVLALGCFEYFQPQGASSRTLAPCSVVSAIDSATATEASQFINTYEAITETSGGLRFDFIRPTNFVKLLSGVTADDPADLVSLNVPTLDVTFGKDINIDVGVADLNGDVDASVFTQLGLVYDTVGLSKMVDAIRRGDDPVWDDLLDGIYIRNRDGNEVEIDIDASATAKIDVELASGSVKANLSGGVQLDLLDPNEDGALRLDEIQSQTDGDASKVFCLVDASASLDAGIKVEVEFFGLEGEVDLNISDVADINLNIKKGLFKDLLEGVGFDLDCLDDLNPILASPRFENGEDVIRIHTGPYASDRRDGDVSDEDGPAVISVEEDGDWIVVTGFGAETSLPIGKASRIVITGGPNADVFDLSGVDSLPVRIEGAGGGDTLFGGDKGDEIYGGDGGDFIDPGAGEDLVVTGTGSNLVISSPGADTIDAGANTDSGGFIYGYELDEVGRLQVTDQGDLIPQPDRNEGDTVIGSIHADYLVGTNVDGGDGDDTITGAGDGGTLDGGEDDDEITGGDGDETLVGGPGEDTLIGGGGADSLLGGDDDDKLISGYGDTLVSGGDGDDELTVDLGVEIFGLGIDGITTTLGLGNYSAASLIESSEFPTESTSFAGIETIADYRLGEGDDSIIIDGVNVPVSISAGAGEDIFHLIATAAEVELNAGGDDDELVIDRSGRIAPMDALLRANRLSGFGAADVTLFGNSLETITITLGDGDDRLRVDAPSPETRIIGGNGDDDTIIVDRLKATSTITAEQVYMDIDSAAAAIRTEFGEVGLLRVTADSLWIDNRDNENALDFSVKDRDVTISGLDGSLIENISGIGRVEFLGSTAAASQDTLKVIDTSESTKTFRIEDDLVEVLQGSDVLVFEAASSDISQEDPVITLEYPVTPTLDGPFHVLFPRAPIATGNPDRHAYVVEGSQITTFDVVSSPNLLLPSGSTNVPFNVNADAVFDPSGRFLYVTGNSLDPSDSKSSINQIAIFERNVSTGVLSLVETIDSFPAGTQAAPAGRIEIVDIQVAEEWVFLTIEDIDVLSGGDTRVYRFDRDPHGSEPGKLTQGRYVGGRIQGTPIDSVMDTDDSDDLFVLTLVGPHLEVYRYSIRSGGDDSIVDGPFKSFETRSSGPDAKIEIQPVRNNQPRKVYLVEPETIYVTQRVGGGGDLQLIQKVSLPSTDTQFESKDVEFNADGSEIYINDNATIKTYQLVAGGDKDGRFVDANGDVTDSPLPIATSNVNVLNSIDADSLARDPRTRRFIAPTADNEITVFSSALEAIQVITDGEPPTFEANSLKKLVFTTSRPGRGSAYGIATGPQGGYLVEFTRSKKTAGEFNPRSILTPDDWESNLLRDKQLDSAVDLVLADDKHLYVAVDSGIQLFQRDRNTGDLDFQTTFEAFADFSGARTLQLSPDGTTLWAGSHDTVKSWSRDTTTGFLTANSGSASLSQSTEIFVDPNSDFLFVALDGSSGGIATRLQSAVGTAAQFTPLPNATSVKRIGNRLYAGTRDGVLNVYSIDAEGKLTLLQTASGGSGGAGSLSDVVDIVSSRGDRFVFAGSSDGTIIAYSRDPSSGRLAFAQRITQGIGSFDDAKGIEEMTSLTFDLSEQDYIADLLYVTSPNGWTAIQVLPGFATNTSSYRVGFDGNFGSLEVASNESTPAGDFTDIVRSSGTGNIPLTIRTFGGNDEISIASQPSSLTLDTGDGNDFVSLRSVSGATTSIELGEGDDAIDVNLPGLQITNDNATVSINGASPLSEDAPPIGDTLTYVVGDLSFDPSPATNLTTPSGQISVDGQVLVKWEEIEDLGELADLSASITVTPESIEEGNSVDLSTTASAEGVTFAESDYQWDLDGDGVFGDRIGSSFALDWSELQELGIDDDGVYPVAVEVVTSGLRTIAIESIVVTNADPVLSASVSPGTIDQFDSVSLTLGSADPGDDTIERWEIDWESDGTVDDIYFIDAGVVTHVYDSFGTKTITATAFDEDGGPYAAVTTNVIVNEIPPRERKIEGNTILDEGATGNYTLVASGGTTTPVSWLVDFGDGTIQEITSTQFTHTYKDDGTYTISAIVLEDDGSSLSATETLTVTVNPVDPTIVTTAGTSPIDEGHVYTLGVDAINDPGDDTITEWTIDWGDGNVETIIGDIRSAAHRYVDDSATEPGGFYQVTVSATDEDGTYPGTASIPVEVSNIAAPMISVPPELLVSPGSDLFSVAEGQPLQLILTNHDPGEDTTTEWIIDWDGNGPMTPVSYPNDPENPLRNVRFVYNAEIAPLEITAVMIDEDGEHPTNVLIGEVTNTAPTPRISGGTKTAIEGTPFFVTLDPGVEGTNSSIVRWRIEWNDGSEAETVVLDQASTVVTVPHVFRDGDGSELTVEAFAIDDANQEYPASLTITVINQPPSIEIDGPPAIEENTEYSLTLGSVIDPAITDTVSTYIIRWGDGTSTELTAQQVADLSRVVSHTYVDDPPFPGVVDTVINVDLIDEDGLTQNAGSTTVRIVNIPPIAEAGGPYQILIPATQIQLSGTATDQSFEDTFTFEWDFNDDGVFDDATGPTPIFDAAGAFPGQIFDVALRVTDDDGGVSDVVSTTVRYLSIPEITDLVLPTEPILENQEFTLTVLFEDVDPNQTHTVTVLWGDGNSSEVFLAGGEREVEIPHTYLDDNPTNTPLDPYNISVTVANSAADDSAETGVDVFNVNPEVAAFTSDASSLKAKSDDNVVSVSGTVADVGTEDTHRAVIDWGDGSDSEIVDVDPTDRTFESRHEYASGGIYEITFTVTDDDTGESEVATTAAVIQGVGLVDGTLFIIGTDGRDKVAFKYDDRTDALTVDVKLNQDSSDKSRIMETFTASSIDRIVAFLCDGNDHYQGEFGGSGNRYSQTSVAIRQIVFAGAGRDQIHGGDAGDALIGGEGKDNVQGRAGNDLLIGGFDRDVIHGGLDDDLLIGDHMVADESLVSIVDKVDNALTSWNDKALPETILALEGIKDDNEQDKLLDKKGENEFIEGGYQPQWVWWIDVNGDGSGSALDALMIINRLSLIGHDAEWTGIEGDDQFDVNGDGLITPSDALMIINRIAYGNSSRATPYAKQLAVDAARIDSVDRALAGGYDDEEPQWDEPGSLF